MLQRVSAAAIVLTAHIGVLSTIPACVYGFASVAGLILLKSMVPMDATVLGAAFGWLSEMLGGKLTKAA